MAFPCMLRLTAATPFSRCRLLTAYQPTVPHISIPSIESHHIPSVVFTRVCHPRSRESTDICRSPLSSFGFRRLRRRHSSSANRALLSNQSSLPLVPFPGIRRPRRFKQQQRGCTKSSNGSFCTQTVFHDGSPVVLLGLTVDGRYRV